MEPLRSVEIVHPLVVGDARASNATDGPWSFRRIIENMAPTAAPASTDPFVRGIFESWLTDQFVNGELLPARPFVDAAILSPFAVPNTSPRQFNLYALKFPGGGNNSMTPTTFSVTVKNNGTVATPAGTAFGVLFQIDGVGANWSDSSNTSLAPGASRTLTANAGPGGVATWTATSGRQRLAAWADDVNRMTDHGSQQQRDRHVARGSVS